MNKILYNAKIFTLDELYPFVEAVLISDGIITAIGSSDEILSLANSNTESVNLDFQSVIPGFTDAHLHLLHLAKYLSKLDCETKTRAECIQRVKAQAEQSKPGEWILGHGWNHNVWDEGIGNAQLLDEVAPNNPVYLTNKSLHGAWANSQALKAANITETTDNPQGGLIGRTDAGIPNGLLYESAVNLIESILPQLTETEITQLIHTAQNYLFSYGITSVHDFDRRLSFSALQEMNMADDLKLNVIKSIPGELLDEAIALGLHSGFGNAKLRMGGIKLFMDGALGTRTAAMLQPYEGETSSGFPLLTQEELYQIACKASDNHLSLAIHAIGDRANHDVITAIENLRDYECKHSNPKNSKYHRIEHVQNIIPEDIAKMSSLNMIASVQPIHLCSDIPAADRNWGARNRNTFAFRSMIDAGIPLIFGSDAPVEIPDCIKGLHAAVNRTNHENQPTDGWYPNQKISILEATRAFCSNCYQIPGSISNKGKILPGYQADLIVLSHDIFDIPDQQLIETQVQKTMIDGEWVWQS